MKLSEARAKVSGLPEGFPARSKKWNDVSETFTIEKAALMVGEQRGEDGQVLVSPTTQKPYLEYQVALALILKSGERVSVRTNSPRLIPLFRGEITEDREPDAVNTFGRRIYIVEPPEGTLRFVPFRYTYKNDLKADVADLEEVE